jgi:hypothetical protein
VSSEKWRIDIAVGNNIDKNKAQYRNGHKAPLDSAFQQYKKFQYHALAGLPFMKEQPVHCARD